MSAPALTAPVCTGTSNAVTVAFRDTAPLALAVLPFGLAIGAAVAESNLSPAGSLAGSFLLMAGAAQLAVIGLLDSGTGIAVAVGTALLINVRFVLYSAGLARWFADEPRWRRLLLAVPLVDQQFLLGQRRFDETTDVRWRRGYYLTATAMLFICFVVGQGVGFRIGSTLPSEAGLELAAPLAFAGMLGLATRDRAGMASAVVAGAVAVVAAGLPGGLTMPIAIVSGIVVASTLPVRAEES